jgi:hypothetical protein
VLVLCDFLLGSFLHTTRSGSFHNCLIVKLFGVGMYMWLVCSGLDSYIGNNMCNWEDIMIFEIIFFFLIFCSLF